MRSYIKRNEIKIKADFTYNLYQNLGFKYQFYDLIKYNEINIPFEILPFIENYGFYLAGGAVIDLLGGSKPNDYDLFFVGNVNNFINILQNIRKI